MPFVAPGAVCTLDFGVTNGLIRPLHGVNGGPLCYRGVVDLTAYHREVGIPLTRLHDVVWVNAEAVDVHTLFRDFRDDPEDPASYDFRATDDYVAAVLNTGARLVYRLGESIEHTPRKYHVNPPTDPARWAAVCVGVIRHYNEGWAGGFHHGIRYWEIWNEPDVRPQMWTGTDAQFFELFATTAKAIKQRFPDVAVGGPGVGGTGTFTGGEFRPTPFLAQFLAYCRDHQVPLDFLSWHRYTSRPREFGEHARAIRQLLDAHGFQRTESHLNEWNYLPDDDWRPMLKDGQGKPREDWYRRMHGPEGAAFTAASLLLFQDQPLDAANYYTGEIQGFGLFDFQGTPKKTFHAFRAFHELTTTPHRLGLSLSTAPTLFAVAGRNADRSRATLLLSSTRAGRDPVTVRTRGLGEGRFHAWEALVIDGQGDLDRRAGGDLRGPDPVCEFTLEGPAVALVRFR